ncbi:MAG: hypothetical protein KGL50_08995 [Burkholderiales bacterium]|nr:hypothetical protein [Burkholderiales bacterium]
MPPCPADRRGLLRAAVGIGLALRAPAGFSAVAPAVAPAVRPAPAALLTLSGRLERPDHGHEAAFDRARLLALPQTSFSTRTPWWADPRRFTGPLLRDVLGAVGASGRTLRLGSLAPDHQDMPFDDALQYGVVVAHRLDGRAMTLRDKGPLLLMYPFDAQPELHSAVYYGRSTWHLQTIEVR